MTKGEVWRVRITPAPEHAQSGERPAIILQDGPLIASLPTVLIVPFTSKPAASRFACTLLVHPDQQNGLAAPSVALVFQLRALDKRDCLQRLGVLNQPTLDQVLALLDRLTEALIASFSPCPTFPTASTTPSITPRRWPAGPVTSRPWAKPPTAATAAAVKSSYSGSPSHDRLAAILDQ